MTIQTTAERNHRTKLRALSGVLQDVHRSLIDFSRERYELANDVVRTRAELLGLLLDDDAFTWLRPLSGLIVEIDELTARDVPPSESEAAEIADRVDAFLAASADPNAFGSRYIALLASEPRVAMNHGELREALWELSSPSGARS